MIFLISEYIYLSLNKKIRFMHRKSYPAKVNKRKFSLESNKEYDPLNDPYLETYFHRNGKQLDLKRLIRA